MRFTRLLLIISVVMLGACSTTGSRNTAPATSPLPYKLTAATRASYKQAVFLVRTGKNRQAERQLKSIIKSRPKLAGPYANLAIVYQRQGNDKQALNMIGRAIELNPGNAEYHNLQGIIARQQGEFRMAETSYLKAIALHPDKPAYHLNLGILLDLYLQEHKRALAEYKTYQDLNNKEDRKVAGWIIDLGRRVQ